MYPLPPDSNRVSDRGNDVTLGYIELGLAVVVSMDASMRSALTRSFS